MMQPLFSPAGQARLDQIVKPDVLCVFDFDGTLVPITAEPSQSRLSQEILERLMRLSSYTPIAVLTGRSVADIRTRLGFEPPYLIGNHGMEGIPGWDGAHSSHEGQSSIWRSILDAHLGNPADFDAGIWIEDKRYSLSVHYRAAPDQEKAAAALTALFASLDPPPRVVAGKCVFNLLPQDAADKGSALVELLKLSGAGSAIYVGDDVTDEDVFRLHRPDLLSVRVEYYAESAAEYYIPDHADIARLLDELIALLHAKQVGKAAQLAGPHRTGST